MIAVIKVRTIRDFFMNDLTCSILTSLEEDENKTIEIEGTVNVKEFLDFLKAFEIDKKEYSLIGTKTIFNMSYPSYPTIIYPPTISPTLPTYPYYGTTVTNASYSGEANSITRATPPSTLT